MLCDQQKVRNILLLQEIASITIFPISLCRSNKHTSYLQPPGWVHCFIAGFSFGKKKKSYYLIGCTNGHTSKEIWKTTYPKVWYSIMYKSNVSWENTADFCSFFPFIIHIDKEKKTWHHISWKDIFQYCPINWKICLNFCSKTLLVQENI